MLVSIETKFNQGDIVNIEGIGKSKIDGFNVQQTILLGHAEKPEIYYCTTPIDEDKIIYREHTLKDGTPVSSPTPNWVFENKISPVKSRSISA
jgi:hypothetical protein